MWRCRSSTEWATEVRSWELCGEGVSVVKGERRCHGHCIEQAGERKGRERALLVSDGEHSEPCVPALDGEGGSHSLRSARRRCWNLMLPLAAVFVRSRRSEFGWDLLGQSLVPVFSW